MSDSLIDRKFIHTESGKGPYRTIALVKVENSITHEWEDGISFTPVNTDRIDAEIYVRTVKRFKERFTEVDG